MQIEAEQDRRAGYSALLQRRLYLWSKRRTLRDPRRKQELETLAYINDKLKGYSWVADRGHAVVPHRGYPSIADALRDYGGERFVLKPIGGHSSQGVYLLQRRAKGGYSCAMTGRDYANDQELIAHYVRKLRQPRASISQEVILEEYVEDSLGYDVPLDYKFYAFGLAVPIVMQRYAPLHVDKANWGFEFYDEEGNRLGPIRLNVSSGERRGMRPPDNLSETFRMARALAAEAQVSFVRIDLYSTPDGPVFGEFTPVPNNGQERFTSAYDRLLGDYWLRSLQALGISYGV